MQERRESKYLVGNCASGHLAVREQHLGKALFGIFGLKDGTRNGDYEVVLFIWKGIKIEIVDQDGEWNETAVQLGIPVVESIGDADLTLIHNYKDIDTYLNSTDSELFVAILTRLDDEERKVAFEEIVEGKCIPEHLRRWRPKQSFECEEGLSIEWTLTYICPGKVRCDGVREIKSKGILKNGCLGCIRLDQFLDEVLFKIEKRSKFGA
ncbi:hypothetical protein O9G_002928 [Rozella allomycis CSF55]|uniref:Uncharacterized protein n=1 Tax=Rozella allomycis (strain CSF55) TaxID=988480 RepID=A0A075ANM4_ROZAC|nr:hypothetical protein O9G_002928 [Rozella allomycis CSF55]|eukprot:EPZ31459.1 hypothetical protein O9G_002928 [Rozella allomycis CSF55]